MISNARIQIMLRTVLTIGQPRSAKGERTKENVTENGSKKIVKRPVRFVKLSYNDLLMNMSWTEINLLKLLFINFFPSG